MGKAVAKLTHPLVKCMKGKSLTARQYRTGRVEKREGRKEPSGKYEREGGRGKDCFTLKTKLLKVLPA